MTRGALADVDVTAYQWRAGAQVWQDVAWAHTDADGRYELSGLEPGSYVVGFDDAFAGGDHAVEYWDGSVRDDSASLAGATPVQATETAAGTTDAELAPGGTVAGRVTGSHSVADVWVSVHEQVGSTWEHVRGTYPAADGSYRLARLPAGSYRISFEDDRGVLATEYWNDAATIARADDVPAGPGAPVEDRDAALAVDPPVDPPVTPPADPPSSPTTAPPTTTPTTTAPTTTAPTTAPPASFTATAAPVQQLTEVLADLRVSGKPTVGRTLRLRNLDASFRGTVSYRIQWYAGTKAIRRATKPKLQVTRALRGRVISVKVRATSGGVSKTKKIKVGKVRG